MKKIIALTTIIAVAFSAAAQFSKATLQAGGLTCSMCSKAVKVALEKVPFVQAVNVDIKSQEYSLLFKAGSDIEFDELKKAVEDAGFSVASLKITGMFGGETVEKDKHLIIEGKSFHFLNGNSQSLSGEKTLTIVDKNFLSEKAFKKYIASSKMECVKTGKAGNCCAKDEIGADTRVYHVII